MISLWKIYLVLKIVNDVLVDLLMLLNILVWWNFGFFFGLCFII